MRSSPLAETKARSGEPAKTTSKGSSPVSMVAATRMKARSTTLIVSETLFTTHTSVALRARTETGSTPTDTEPAWRRYGGFESVSKTSIRPSGVLATMSLAPPGTSSIGWT